MKGKYVSMFLALFIMGAFQPSIVCPQEKTGEVGLHDNGNLKIIKIKVHDLGSTLKKTKTVIDVSGVPIEYCPESSGTGDYVEVLVEILKELSEEKGHKVCVHYYDSKGELMPGDSETTEKALSVGEIRAVIFDSMPYEARSFKIWLPKSK